MSKPVILCVDDEKIVLDSLKRQLRERLGDRYSYELAESAEDAAEVIEELQADGVNVVLIMSDWLMPGKKGDDFLIEVHHDYPDIVKVMLTGQAEEAALQRVATQANLHRCLHKPWTEEELVEAICSGLPGG